MTSIRRHARLRAGGRDLPAGPPGPADDHTARATPRARASPSGGAASGGDCCTTARRWQVRSCFCSSWCSRSFPAQIAPYSPSAEIFGINLPPSGAHWLGTTSFGQDSSRSSSGERQSVIIAFAAGGLATDRGHRRRDGRLLRRLADGSSHDHRFLLVIPVFPLFIVIAAYLRNAGLLEIIIILGALSGLTAPDSSACRCSRCAPRLPEGGRGPGRAQAYIIVAEIIPSMTSLIVAAFWLTPSSPSSRRPASSSWGSATRCPELGHDAVLGPQQRGPGSGSPCGRSCRGFASPCSAPRSPS